MQAVEHLIRIVSAIWIFAHGGLLVHAAGLERNGLGYLFTGPSGAGKSTVCRVSKDALILNDDLVVLRETESELEVWATPFSNPKQNKPNPGTAKLRSVFILCQAEFHKVEPENAAIALADLISKTPIVAAFPENVKILLERCQRFLSHVQVYRLHFLPDDQFWRIIPE
jgi:energy-coupling factor transporter ATP-binding protein EcfA2